MLENYNLNGPFTNAARGVKPYSPAGTNNLIRVMSDNLSKIIAKETEYNSFSELNVLSLNLTNGRCFYCGAQLIDMKGRILNNIERDHLIPASKYGLYSKYNVVLSCSGCNNEKRDSEPKSFYLKRIKDNKQTLYSLTTAMNLINELNANYASLFPLQFAISQQARTNKLYLDFRYSLKYIIPNYFDFNSNKKAIAYSSEKPSNKSIIRSQPKTINELSEMVLKYYKAREGQIKSRTFMTYITIYNKINKYILTECCNGLLKDVNLIELRSKFQLDLKKKHKIFSVTQRNIFNKFITIGGQEILNTDHFEDVNLIKKINTEKTFSFNTYTIAIDSNDYEYGINDSRYKTYCSQLLSGLDEEYFNEDGYPFILNELLFPKNVCSVIVMIGNADNRLFIDHDYLDGRIVKTINKELLVFNKDNQQTLIKCNNLFNKY